MCILQKITPWVHEHFPHLHVQVEGGCVQRSHARLEAEVATHIFIAMAI